VVSGRQRIAQRRGIGNVVPGLRVMVSSKAITTGWVFDTNSKPNFKTTSNSERGLQRLIENSL
jgi:hypothetical protein